MLNASKDVVFDGLYAVSISSSGKDVSKKADGMGSMVVDTILITYFYSMELTSH